MPDNITEDGFRSYIDVFHRTYKETVDKFMPDKKDSLFRYQFLSGGTILFVSTKYGIGYEYVDCRPLAIATRRSSARIEDLFFDPPTELRNVRRAVMTIASSMPLEGGVFPGPLSLEGEDAAVFMRDCVFYSKPWLRTIKYAELFGNRSTSFWSSEQAVARAKDEVLFAQIHEQPLPTLGSYLDHFKEKTVLVLGDYSGDGKARLQSIHSQLAGFGYDPVLVDELPELPELDLSQKAVTVGSVARFVVIDDSSASGHLVEYAHAITNRWMMVVLREEQSHGSFMSRGASIDSRNVLELTYTDGTLGERLREAKEWVEARIEERGEAFRKVYPWRRTDS